MLNRWITTGLLVIAIIILIGVTQVYAEKTESEAAKLDQLKNTADMAMDQVDRLVIKWQGEGKGDAQKQAEVMAQQLGLHQPVLVRQTGHDVYRSEADIDADGLNAGRRVNVVVTGENTYYTIVHLSGNGRTDWHGLTALHEQVGQMLKDSGMEATWNFSVQGTGGTESEASIQVEQIEENMSGKMDVQSVERYTDANTASVSYKVPNLPIAIQSGSHILNMQLAVHQDNEKGINRITVGFPVITIEY
ncbi:YwmB family TATA-box binding protein [Paenibacillus sp. QZ-Y1]|uniref:YwmB family TATA-box binding protein n=1 Tax=Paenibacillus sp. QZ-Y1 TaxID=3414511 RepID=UPI003F79A98A